jgi:hypothetical protein
MTNCTLLTIIALTLANPLSVGMVSNPTHTVAQEQFEDVVLAQTRTDTLGIATVEFPYEIADELIASNVVALDTGGVRTDIVEAQGIIQQGLANVYSDVYAGGDGDPLNSHVYLIDTASNIVAMDFVIPALRNRLVFSHENTARAQVMQAHPLLRNFRYHSDSETWIRIYNAIDQHPQFGNLVALFQEVGYLPNRDDDPRSDEFYSWTREIALDLIDELLYPDGSPKPQ